MTFNVLTEPWIPMSDGRTLSLLDALEGAQALEGVECASPLETVAVYRLMIAFLMDAVQLKSRHDRLALLRQGRFDMAAIRTYASRCEAEGASFDLFDAKRPFMQAAYDPALDKERKSAAILALEIPSGNNHVFFDHAPEARFAPDEALRQMLTAYLFCTVGGSGYRASLIGTPSYYILLCGNNLFETLVYNMLSIGECGNADYGKPAWREEHGPLPNEQLPAVSVLAGLTWQPRRITLIADNSDSVSEIYWQPGRWIDAKVTPWRDLHVAYVRNKNGAIPLIPKKGRAFWQDFDAIIASKDDERCGPPLVFLDALEESPWHRLFIAGMITNKATKFEILSHNRVMIPNCIRESEEHRDELRFCLETMEIASSAMEYAARQAFDGNAKKKRGKQKEQRFGEAIVAPALKDVFFKQAGEYVSGKYMEELAACNSDETFVDLRNLVSQKVLHMMLNAIETVQSRLGSQGKILLTQAKMRRIAVSLYHQRQNGKEK